MDQAVQITGTAVMLALLQWVPAGIVRLIIGPMKSYGAWIAASIGISAAAFVVGILLGLDVETAANWFVLAMAGTAAILYAPNPRKD
jgi:hypothetical protein